MNHNVSNDAGSAAERFRALHESFFVMPNPVDRGTARLLAGMGFDAIATSSAGLAWTLGLPDGGIDRATAIAHAADIADSTGLPVNGDFEAGYGDTPEEVAETVRQAIDAGVAGCSVEDLWRNGPDTFYDEATACRRLEAAREAIDKASSAFVLTGRAEMFLTKHPDPFPEALSRLKAYANAGAHVVYAPGLTAPGHVAEIVDRVPVPVNVIAGLGGVSNDLAELKALGVRRISLGSGLAKVALGAFISSAEALREGRIDLTGATSSGRLHKSFSAKPGA
ncbi:MAG: isocitrate lyase/phosphoenolpyruvate mutase family protein [Pseudomonadota bacterium]